MEEDELLARLRREIEPDLNAVRPLRPPGVRTLGMLATWLLLGVAALTLLGLRSDFAVLGAWLTIGSSLVEVAVCCMLVLVGFRLAIPGMSVSVPTALAWIVVALLVNVAADWGTVQYSAISPAPGQESRAGLVCLGGIVVLGLAPFALGAMLLSSGLLSRPSLALTLLGFASGLAAVAAWRLHCAYSNLDHTFPFHTSALGLYALAALAVAAILRSRT